MKRTLMFKLAVSSLVLGTAAGCAGMGKMSEHAARAAESPSVAAKSADKARTALNQGKASKAVSLAEAAVAASPRDGSYRQLLGQAYLNDGRFHSAASAFGEAMELGVVDSQTVISLALAQIAQGKNAEAVSLITKNSAILPASDAGLALALAGDLEPAIYVLTGAARQEGADARTRQNLALALAFSGRWAQARVVAAQDLSPDKIDARMAEWSAMAQQTEPALRMAKLIDVNVQQDAGMPVRLALGNFAAPVAMAAADTAPAAADDALVLASADPAPIAEYAPAPRVVAAAAPAIRSIELPMPQRDASGVVPVSELPQPVVAKPTVSPVIMADAKPYRAAPRVAGEGRAAQVEARALAAELLKPTASFDAKKPSGWAVQLGAYDSLAIAKEKWTVLSKRNAGLSGFPASSHAASVKGKRFYRLTVNGLASRADANNLCHSLKAAGQRCFIRHMSGAENVRWASRSSTVRVASR